MACRHTLLAIPLLLACSADPSASEGSPQTHAVSLADSDSAAPLFYRERLPGVRDVAKFSWYAPLHYEHPEPVEVTVAVRFLDAHGAELHSATRAQTMRPNSTHRFSGEWLAMASEAYRVNKMELAVTDSKGRTLHHEEVAETWTRERSTDQSPSPIARTTR